MAETYRDKAIILCLFQSGLSIHELCKLNFGDVRDELEEGTLPLHLRLIRQKTGTEFKCFFGRDACKYLLLYLKTRRTLKDDSPLFTKWSNEERITTAAVEMKFRLIAEKLSFISEKDMEGYNPCRPHSLRAAFASRLTGKIDRVLIEFWMGHSIGEQIRAYLRMPLEEMRKLYVNAETYLAIERASQDELNEQKEKKLLVSKDMVTKIEEMETSIQILTKQNVELQRRFGNFNKLVDLSPVEIDTISEIIQNYLQQKWIKEDQNRQQEIEVEQDQLVSELKIRG
jgi:integrase/recombinase XerD